nr:glycosyltransferase [uncultured Sphaerochaeta sp.]
MAFSSPDQPLYSGLPGPIRADQTVHSVCRDHRAPQGYRYTDSRFRPTGSTISARPGFGRSARLYWEPILKPIGDHDLADRIHILEYIPDEALPSLYSGASVLALPSRYEGFGFPVLEAMACGTPVVCSNVASLPEIAGSAAALVPSDNAPLLADAIESIISDPDLAESMVQAGLTQAVKLRMKLERVKLNCSKKRMN